MEILISYLATRNETRPQPEQFCQKRKCSSEVLVYLKKGLSFMACFMNLPPQHAKAVDKISVK